MIATWPRKLSPFANAPVCHDLVFWLSKPSHALLLACQTLLWVCPYQALITLLQHKFGINQSIIQTFNNAYPNVTCQTTRKHWTHHMITCCASVPCPALLQQTYPTRPCNLILVYYNHMSSSSWTLEQPTMINNKFNSIHSSYKKSFHPLSWSIPLRHNKLHMVH